MIQKWKKILTNWINCYFNENHNAKVQYVTLECLLNIISHLHKNFNLDESRSSTLDAQTVEGFILEKFPQFRFENGSVEAVDDDDLYLVASLLLYFVCVNSKDMDIKYAMCSTLTSVDQEIIMRFSKCLMECSVVTARDVQVAITEACGQDTATMDNQPTVSETPPALRSLHSEVRRLQAALDAERFDRNYLQEELARTNMKFEKLLKDKEQYKLEILNLKTKISLCCGQEVENNSEFPDNAVPTKLIKQLKELEERLIETQSQLDDVQCERDSCKAKISELRKERDKWLVLSQQESTRAERLVEELQAERQNVQSLRELVTELRHHNQLKGFNTSQIECDDPDTSIQSPHNLSVCSEACVNVVEVQLGEERAKIEILKQQIQNLQDQLNEFNSRTENEKHKLQEQITERDIEICSLRRNINEEIVEKNNLKANFNDEISKLNNMINELQQHLTDDSERAKINIEKKTQETQILQEEKLSLLDSLTSKCDETTKLDIIIKELQVDIATEKSCKSKMKEDYENHIMKLNEKVLNRNNELVDLQNNILEKSEMIEKLHFDLRKEKELKEDLSNKCNNEIMHLNSAMSVVELNLHQKSEEATQLQKELQQSLSVNDELKKEINYLSKYTTQLEVTNKHLNDCKEQLSLEINKCNDNLDAIHKNMEDLQNIFSQEKQQLLQDLNVKDTSIRTLTEKIDNEIANKNLLQNEVTRLQEVEMKLNSEVIKLNNEMSALRTDVQEKDQNIYALELHIQEEKNINSKLNHDCECLNEKLKKSIGEIEKKILAIKIIKEKHNIKIKSFEEIFNKNNNEIQTLNSKLMIAVEDKNGLLIEIDSMREEKESLSGDISSKSSEIINLQSLVEKMSENLGEYEKAMKLNEQKFEMEMMKFEEIRNNYDAEEAKFMSKVNDYEKEIAKLESQTRVQEQDKKYLLEEMHDVNQKLHNTISEKEKIETEYKMLECLKEDFVRKDNELTALQNEIKILKQSLEVKCEDIKAMEVKLNQQTVSSQDGIRLKTSEVKELQEKLTELQSINMDLQQNLKYETDYNIQENTALQEKNKLLQFTLNEANTNYKASLKEQDTIIKTLEQEIKTQRDEITELLSSKQQLEKKCDNEGQCKTKEIHVLQNDIQCLQDTIEKNKANHQELLKDKDTLLDKLEEELKTAFKDVTVLQLRNENLEQELNSEIQSNIEKIEVLQKENQCLRFNIELQNTSHEANLKDKSDIIERLEQENKLVYEQIADIQTANDNLQQLMKNEIESKLLAIQALHIENENLQCVIERDNSNHKALLKDRDTIIETLEFQIVAGTEKLKLLQKEYEEERVTLEKCKVDLQENLEANNNKIKNLEEDKKILENNLNEIEKVKEDLIKKIDVMTREDKNIQNERQNVIQNLLEEKRLGEMKYAELLRERNDLLSRLASEKSAKDLVETEKEQLVVDNEILHKQLIEEQSAGNRLVSDKNILLNEKEILTQELLEQTVIREIAEKEKLTLSDEKLVLVQQLTEESLDKQSILEGKDLIIKQLVEEKLDQDVIQGVLITDKEMLTDEMKMIMITLTEEKAAKDEIENEKNTQLKVLMAANDERVSDIKNRDRQLTNLNEELSNLKSYCLRQEELNIQLTSTLNNGLEKLFQNLRNEPHNSNEILRNLLTMDLRDLQIDDKCELLINIADALTTELSLKKNLENVLQHETSTVHEMTELIKHKELRLQELQTEVKDLQQQLYQNKIELSKQSGSFTMSLDSKDRECLKVQNENQSLRNELNDVRVQLEVKCHSLKEKLINNENITDKLKSTYECQINNLNVMTNKLTSYLKDKTLELDCIRKEKDKLQCVIEDNSRVIKTLEEEVRTEKQNREKLISDFESERLVLKNMVTVTESVMDDQKVGLNKLIGDHIKANEMLREEIKSLTEQIELIKRNSEIKVKEKESAFEIAFNEMRELKSEKEKLEKDVKELKTEIIHTLKEELISKDSINKSLESHNKELTVKLESSENDLAKLQELKDEEKIKMDSLQVELKDKVDTLTETVNDKSEQILKLEVTLKEKKQQNVEMEGKIKDLACEVEKLITEKSALEMQKCECARKFDDMMQKIDGMTKEHEELVKLTNDNIHLYQVIEQNKTVIANLEQKMQLQLDQKQQCNETDSEKLNLANKCALLQEYQNKAEKELEDRQKELEKQRKELEEQQKEIISLRTEVDDLRTQVKHLQQQVTSVNNEKDLLISEIKKELEDEKMLKERFLEELNVKTAAVYELRQKLGDARNDEVLCQLMRENEELIKAIGQRETCTAISLEKLASLRSHPDKDSREPRHQKQLYQEQIGMYKEKQKEEIAVLERELYKAREKFTESSRRYEKHIKDLTTELWTVGEKFLMKKDEAEWLRKKQQSGSLMSLQHIHSSGLVPHQVELSRASDAHSLRSLPINNNKNGRGLHMSDEEGEVFDNRWLPSLSTPRAASRSPPLSPGARLSELRWRNSLCPPHLKSSYPAETQFAPAFNEDEIKCAGTSKMSIGGKSQRKEVGITAYKKPGPPTPSKQAGRLSATDSELRESLRPDAEPQPARKTSTPSRLRSLFRSNRADDCRGEGTPRSRRLSNIFRKK